MARLAVRVAWAQEMLVSVSPTTLDLTGDSYARDLDARDPLAAFRERFYVQPDTIYLDGNSLGLLSKDAEAALLGALDDWKRPSTGRRGSGARSWRLPSISL